MYSNTPKPKNTYAKIVSLICLLMGAALFVLANTKLFDSPALLQLAGIVLMTAAIYIASVYLLRQYSFSVEQNPSSEQKELDFVIMERRGKREIAVCRIGLDEIVEAREVNKQNKKQITENRRKMQRYTYDTTFIAPRRIELLCKYDDADISILVTYDEKLLTLLNSK